VTDDEDPVFVNCPPAGFDLDVFTNDCVTDLFWPIPVAIDNCNNPTVVETTTGGPLYGTSQGPGTYTIEYTATDDAGRTTTCGFTINVIDTEDPVIINCPYEDQEIFVDDACEAFLPDYMATMQANDNCGYTWTQDPLPGTQYTAGDLVTVTVTATDDAMNSTDCVFDVHVIDDIDPEITCPADIAVVNDPGVCGAVVTFADPDVDDNCPLIVTGPASLATFNFTGTVQTFTVPAGVTEITIEGWGAQGASSGTSTGGLGGYVSGTLAVTPGEVLSVNVGGSDGYNGGGAPGTGGSGFVSNGGVGGGASDVRQGGTALTDRIIVAGGGGGHGRDDCNNNNGGAGGYPGGLGGMSSGIPSQTGLPGTLTGGGNSASGSCNGDCACSPGGGGGGGQDGGGGGGSYGTYGGGVISMGGTGGACGEDGDDGTGGAGSAGEGGCFGTGGAGGNSSNGGGAGGGGGWYGGGAGGGNWASGGGGGSSYLGGVTAISDLTGINTGNGQIIISYVATSSLVQTEGLSSGSVFPVGTTTNTFVVTDASGNTAECSFDVTVTDTELPVVDCTGLTTAITTSAGGTGDCEGEYTWAIPNPTDNCGIINYTVVYTNPDGSIDGPFDAYVYSPENPNNGTPTATRNFSAENGGVTTVTYYVEDIHGNTNTCSFTVTVTDDDVIRQ